MTKGRMVAFRDGVLAVIITIMVPEIKPPHGTSIIGLQPLFPVFFSYVMSFVYVGIGASMSQAASCGRTSAQTKCCIQQLTDPAFPTLASNELG